MCMRPAPRPLRAARERAHPLPRTRSHLTCASHVPRPLIRAPSPHSIAAEGDTWFLIWAGVLVFFMQAGFGMLEAGSVRAKNTKNILLKNILDASLAALIWWLVGYGFAYGDSSDGGFIGTGASGFAFSSKDWEAGYSSAGYDWAGWFFQYTFAAAAATIVSGGVAERCNLVAYLIYSTVITGFIYPVVVHWIWDSEGFMSAFASGSLLGGCIDFAGSGVVHMTGGVAALMGAAILGPRIGRFDESGKPLPMPGHSSVLVVLGTFILWVGWYGFNGGSTLGVFAYQYGRDLARVCVTTTLSAGTCGLVVVVVTYFLSHVWDVTAVANGVLAGLVSITAGCVIMDPWAAIVTGFIGAFVYMGASKLLLKLKIDDPLDAFAVHGASGFWGVLACGIFCRPEYSYNLMGSHGFLYAGKGDLIGIQLVALGIEIAWVAITSGLMFFALKVTGLFRVSQEVEEAGMDVSKHGGEAYSMGA
jgi:Amt family ammonium transporter